MQAVSPTLVVVADDMFANFCPLLEIGRRNCAVLFDLVLDGLTETEKRLRAGIQTAEDRLVGASEIVGRGIVYVGVEIAENIRYINEKALTERASDVMQARVWSADLAEIMKILKIFLAEPSERRLTDGVHRLDLANGRFRVDFDDRHTCLPVYFTFTYFMPL
jgi:hypothetical protein